MLFLSRRVGESILIGDSIEISISAIKGGQVKLGFTYPAGTKILRKEVYLRIQEENRQAASQAVAITEMLMNKKDL